MTKIVVEEGIYQCRCVVCRRYFTGHKREVVCQGCKNAKEVFKSPEGMKPHKTWHPPAGSAPTQYFTPAETKEMIMKWGHAKYVIATCSKKMGERLRYNDYRNFHRYNRLLNHALAFTHEMRLAMRQWEVQENQNG